jgi:2-oxoglutarate dehydrogenase E1 component
MARRLDFIQRANSAYIEQQYERYVRDPASVPEDWALFFAGFDLAADPARAPGRAQESGGTFGLVNAYRQFGHRIARLDPLGDHSESHPLLELSAFGLAASDLDREVDAQPFHGPVGARLRDLIAALRETYCGTLGVEYMNIPDPERRAWLEQKMESAHNQAALNPEARRLLLEQMLTADAFEQFLHVRFPGQKRFSLEGAGTLVPMLNALIERAAAMNVLQVVIGMPHRGRLNVLANVMGKPLETIFSEFESSFAPEDVTGHGDVKYHLGYSSHWDAPSGHRVHLDLNFNPSHLEFVNPVVLGAVRARQDFMRDVTRAGGLPVLIHGDAAFSGEGIVAETLALAQLSPYQTGGTLHIIVNNQIGFTTSPADVRVTRYPTDIAAVIEAPVFHVNGDDPEAALHALTLALEYRATFHRDVFVDLVCYRLHGHNELDDPTFTQPVMYQKIASHVPAARAYAAKLEAGGIVSAAEREAIEARIAERLSSAHTRARTPGRANGEDAPGGLWKGLDWGGSDASADTRTPAATLRAIARAAARVPDAFHPHPKVAKLLEARVQMVEDDRIDWGCAEVLALGSLLSEGRRVRMSGQDTGRGTFSHRHAVLRDVESGERYVPLSHLTPDQGTFEIFDTLLSEAAALGFEYGYSTADPHALVVWEAQFGDFANVAQVYIDQFLASAESKWRRMSGLTLLLPHGYEGQGPEHSSARLERFLELCADGNLQVCNLTTPAQLFHALRRQLHRSFRKPLVIMSPKSLLRHRLAVSPLAEFSDGTFRSTIDDATIAAPEAVERVLLVSGKFYYTLFEAREKLSAPQRERIAIVRVEQLYPFPHAELDTVFRRYASALDIRWVQEEPANMGAWRHLRHRLEAVLPERAVLTEITRRAAPTPATGWYPKHVEQENALIDEALRSAEVRDTSRPGTLRPRRGLGTTAARRRP